MQLTGGDRAKEVEERRPLIHPNYGAAAPAYKIDGPLPGPLPPFAFVESVDGGVAMVSTPKVPGVATIRTAAGLDKPQIPSLAPLPGGLAPPS